MLALRLPEDSRSRPQPDDARGPVDSARPPAERRRRLQSPPSTRTRRTALAHVRQAIAPPAVAQGEACTASVLSGLATQYELRSVAVAQPDDLLLDDGDVSPGAGHPSRPRETSDKGQSTLPRRAARASVALNTGRPCAGGHATWPSTDRLSARPSAPDSTHAQRERRQQVSEAGGCPRGGVS